nr:Rpn family recombination-promoting nuclease/putative transposase [uncultured Thiocystis sp.]
MRPCCDRPPTSGSRCATVTYQIEIQLLNHPDLPARMLYGWADLYSSQLQNGEAYATLKPTYAIWLLGQPCRAGIAEYAHRFRLRDEQGRGLLDHGGIWLLELSKFDAEAVETEERRWLKFFREGERLDDAQLPAWMQTEEMQQAMSTLRGFSEKERAYSAYQNRQNYLRVQMSLQQQLDTLRTAAEQARAAEEQARAEATAALAEIERLKRLLADKGES